MRRKKLLILRIRVGGPQDPVGLVDSSRVVVVVTERVDTVAALVVASACVDAAKRRVDTRVNGHQRTAAAARLVGKRTTSRHLADLGAASVRRGAARRVSLAVVLGVDSIPLPTLAAPHHEGADTAKHSGTDNTNGNADGGASADALVRRSRCGGSRSAGRGRHSNSLDDAASCGDGLDSSLGGSRSGFTY